jgi:hypothetical protein
MMRRRDQQEERGRRGLLGKEQGCKHGVFEVDSRRGGSWQWALVRERRERA